MYVTIDSTNYNKIKVDFAPAVDLTGNSLPANEFTVRIQTYDTISAGQWVALYDDVDTLWAKYWIVSAERLHDDFWEIRAQSIIARLDRYQRDVEVYQQEPVTNVLSAIFLGMPAGCYELDQSLQSETITGFCPQQSARERLLWVCFVLGAYIKDYFTDKIEIVPIGSTTSIIDAQDTYFRPSVTFIDYVTAITVRAYTYTQGEPEVTDDWISDGASDPVYYIETTQDFTTYNSNAPAGAPENEVRIDNVKIINTSNASQILTRLSQYYFNRAQVNLGCINNAVHHPGKRVYGYLTPDQMIAGYIESCTFGFGKQAKSDLVIVGVGGDIIIDAVKITVKYMFGSITLNKQTYTFPKDYAYSIQNQYIDTQLNGHRYVFRPTHSTITGVASADTTLTEPMIVALDFYQSILHVISVDDSTEGTAGEVEIS